jgi:Uri superfamily endonuclease
MGLSLKGAYALIIYISEDINVRIGSLGLLNFEKGTWVYTGSAMGEGSTSLEKRLQRHFSKDKSIFWHIDWLLESRVLLSVAIWGESTIRIECQISQALIKSPFFNPGHKGFGSSDCQSECGTHLFHYIGNKPIIEALREIFLKLGLDPQMKS